MTKDYKDKLLTIHDYIINNNDDIKALELKVMEVVKNA